MRDGDTDMTDDEIRKQTLNRVNEIQNGNAHPVICAITGVAITVIFVAVIAMVVLWMTGVNINLEPGVVIDKTVHPASHALYGMNFLPKGSGTYCLYAETLTRGEPVIIGLHYRIPVQIPADRFGSTEYAQAGKTFTADNNRVVNETITVPEAAIDSVITVSYAYYTDDIQRVHLVVKRCGEQP
jgi:hypothetical protein